MTNYDLLFQEQMKDPQFATAYYEARWERLFGELLDTLRDKIDHNESKENLLQLIDSIQQQFQTTVAQLPRKVVAA